LYNRRTISGLGGTDSATTGRKVIVMTVKEETLRLTPRQREGRAINAVAELLRRTLSVPNIYLEPPASLISADVLAVDRGGAGDLHAVEIELAPILNPTKGQRRKPSRPRESNARSTGYLEYREIIGGIHRRLMSMPAHYRYLAIPEDSYEIAFNTLVQHGLFRADGIGRLGIIVIAEKGEGPPTARMDIAPERFRVDPAKLEAIETKLLAKGRPDIEVRI
jgi:hypothetical protein